MNEVVRLCVGLWVEVFSLAEGQGLMPHFLSPLELVQHAQLPRVCK